MDSSRAASQDGALDARPMPKLYVLSSPDVGRSFALADGATLGRDPGCAIVLRDASISRKHARFELADGAWRVVDTGSRNGLQHAGERVESIALSDGLEFALGEVALRFRADVRAPATPLAPEPERAPEVPIPPRAAAPAAEPDEIVLEGAWDEPRASAPPRASVSAPPPELERTQLRPPRAEPPPSTPQAPSAPAASEHSFASRAPSPPLPDVPAPPPLAGAKPGLTARAPVAGRGGAAAARAVLQYQRVQDDDRALNADLAQLPAWLKLALAVLALAVFAVVFWLAFEGTSFFKGKLGGAADPAETENEPETAPRER